MDERLVDKRLVDRNLEQGRIDRKAYKQYLETLSDCKENADWVQVEEEPSDEQTEQANASHE